MRLSIVTQLDANVPQYRMKTSVGAALSALGLGSVEQPVLTAGVPPHGIGRLGRVGFQLAGGRLGSAKFSAEVL